MDAPGALRREGADPSTRSAASLSCGGHALECGAAFDALKGFARGMRVFSNATVSAQRAALALGIDPHLPPVDALREWRNRRGSLTMHKPKLVSQGPVLENSTREVDLHRFPAPTWHRDDGGPYIGSGSIVVMRDPDSGWVNASIYRVQVHGKDRVTVQFDHQGPGAIIAATGSGEPCPVAR